MNFYLILVSGKLLIKIVNILLFIIMFDAFIIELVN